MGNKRDASTSEAVDPEAYQAEIRQGIGELWGEEIQETDEFTIMVEWGKLESWRMD